IYPPYYAAVGLSLLLIVWLGADDVVRVQRSLSMPESAHQWLVNFTLLGLDSREAVRLVPPGWALHVEVTFYLLIAAGLGRWRPVTFAWLAASIGYTIWLNTHGDYDETWGARYFSIGAASLPFAMGSTLYHLG